MSASGAGGGKVDFIFLFSLNNSGTTVMSQYLAQQTGGYLPPFGNNEGQMAPGVRSIMRRGAWNPEQPFDWGFIRDEWEKLARAARNDLFIEASPPNFLRADEILAEFAAGTRSVFSVSSPYAFIASVLYNYKKPPLKRKMIVEAARGWVKKADLMRQRIEAHPDIPRIRYEDFCADPSALNLALGVPVKALGEINGKKNTGTRKIVDQTRRQLAFLTAKEWDAANSVLARHADLVAFFGYRNMTGEEIVEEARLDSLQFAAGRQRRTDWAPGWLRRGALKKAVLRLVIGIRGLLARKPTRRP